MSNPQIWLLFMKVVSVVTPDVKEIMWLVTLPTASNCGHIAGAVEDKWNCNPRRSGVKDVTVVVGSNQAYSNGRKGTRRVGWVPKSM